MSASPRTIRVVYSKLVQLFNMIHILRIYVLNIFHCNDDEEIVEKEGMETKRTFGGWGIFSYHFRKVSNRAVARVVTSLKL